MEKQTIISAIQTGEAVLGIELGSTRIKAVLIGPDHAPIASGSHDWENQYENGLWTYSLEDVWSGLRDAYGRKIRRTHRLFGLSLEAGRASAKDPAVR